ncbi:zinc-ribbon domain-containing protein [Methylobacterium sp. SyP6R]|uniref:zinc-ribbon domain-containing protein n=1 Tax=Methylobacterium sp. SyP6R TaxID=2718876 RepID=UPI001F2B5BA0|nr:zinc-ribbon domain-containing protein [Methylobacterium sp. SyP6R]MCF4124154.1 zinc-ribbon domain-containing protein [Methylobacterium sp. SyP6R]
MLIVCPACASEYTLDPEQIGPAGRTVRCAACREPWFVAAPPPEPGLELSPTGEAVFSAAETAPPRRAGPRTAKAKAAPARRRLAVAALAVAGCAAIGLSLMPAGRAAIVRALPQTARLYAGIGLPVNLRGLTFRDVAAYQVPDASGVGRLVVEGDVVSASKEAVPVPPLRVELRDEHGQVIFRWTAEAPRDRLEPEESARFRAELPNAPAKGRAVLVRFAAVDSGDSAVSLRAPMNPQANLKDR